MVRRDRTKINNLRDDLKKFQNNLWELENSDGFQFCAKYAEKCSKGNKFGFNEKISKYPGINIRAISCPCMDVLSKDDSVTVPFRCPTESPPV